MRENRLSGSEGGGAELNRLSLPLSKCYGRVRGVCVVLLLFLALRIGICIISHFIA
jgi:hypothetical protein